MTVLSTADPVRVFQEFATLDLDGNLLLAEDPFPGHAVVYGRLALGAAPGLGVKPR